MMAGERHLLLTTDAVGGVWQYSVDLAEALGAFDYRVTLAVMGPAASAEQRAKAASIAHLDLIDTGLPLDWIAEDAAEVVAAEERLAQMAGDLRADLVQLHTPALASIGRYPCPVVAVLHSCVASWWQAVRKGPMPTDFGWRTALIAKGLRNASLTVAPSAAFAADVRRIYGVAPMPVHNGRALPCPSLTPHDQAFTAGRLWDEGKNVATLDRAAAKLTVPFKAAGPSFSPQGDGPAFQALHRLGSLGEAELAQHLGARPVFASAALYEPFGLAVLEAASAGCALILSDIPTFRELWDGAATFVPACDAGGFANAIEAMIEDSAARHEAGERARERATRYTPGAMASRMAGLYDRLKDRVAA
ncbi:glycosyltransferase family 4 protein [Sphingobium olei]|uniref:Glycosyltransferase family 4 protein n=1 Tax=Sphingobium olei TaxID=420955 RepID=A0ABW3P6B6_9SPHN